MDLSIALIAEGSAGVRALQLLGERGHRVAAVFTDSQGGGSMASVASVAESLGAPRRPAGEVRAQGVAEWLRAEDVALVLNVFSLHIVPGAVCEAPSLGAFNLHPGPLPERAGLNAPSWALYEGAASHGVTLHRMTSEVDAGAIAFADDFELTDSDTGLSVTLKCVQRGLPLIAQLLDAAERGEPIPAHSQDLSRRRWLDAGPPDGGRLDWGRSARDVVNFIRACDFGPFESPWGWATCKHGDRLIGVASARVLEEPTGAQPGTVVALEPPSATVAAGDGLVRVDAVGIDGQRVAAASRLQPGERLS